MSTERPTSATPGFRRRPEQQRSKATRAKILAAATQLFIRDGYLATTMASIAAEAGVAVQSLYLRFGGKFEILRAAFDVAIVGDLEQVPFLERAWFATLRETAEGPEAVRIFVAEVTQLASRTYPIYSVIHAAAASEVGELLREIKRLRYEGIRTVAKELKAKPGFNCGLSELVAADLIYGQVSEEHYGLLVADRGWSPEAWEQSCRDILSAALFPGYAAERRPRA